MFATNGRYSQAFDAARLRGATSAEAMHAAAAALGIQLPSPHAAVVSALPDGGQWNRQPGAIANPVMLYQEFEGGDVRETAMHEWWHACTVKAGCGGIVRDIAITEKNGGYCQYALPGDATEFERLCICVAGEAGAAEYQMYSAHLRGRRYNHMFAMATSVSDHEDAVKELGADYVARYWHAAYEKVQSIMAMLGNRLHRRGVDALMASCHLDEYEFEALFKQYAYER